MRRLDKSIESLVNSYDSYGLVNHSGGDNLPSRDSIEDILNNLDELIFPGYRERKDLDHDNLRLITGEKVNHLARELIQEVEKSIGYAMRQDRDPEPAAGDYGGLYGGCRAAAELVVEDFFEEVPKVRAALALDMEAAFRGDPAAKSTDEVILSYPGFQAIVIHRLAHFFWTRQVPLIPRMMSEFVHSRTGIDIHPGAQIGDSFFIDHGTGVVIGETTVIGKNVKLYQGVTLGALSVKKEEADKKRHPTIEDDVTIYANATILGGRTVIGRGSVLGGSVWITESVPPDSTVYIRTGDQVVKPRKQDL
jgi:serine O-acetyltransferase